MKSGVRLFGYPVHRIVVVLPAGLLGCSAILDLLHAAWPAAGLVPAAYWTMACGLLGALAAAPFRFIDWRALPRGSRARRAGAWQGIGRVVLTLVFAASWLLRRVDEPPSGAAVALSTAGLAGLLVTAWLGGELVSRLGVGVGVDSDARADAPSSFRKEGFAHADPHAADVSELDLERFNGAYAAWKETTAAYEEAIRRMHAGDPEARKTAQDLARELARLQHSFLESSHPYLRSAKDREER